MEMRPPLLLFSQHTVCAEQALLPPTPMTDKGEQVRPTPTLPPRTIPRRPAMSCASGSFEVVSVLQHWTGPVEHEPPGEPEGWCLLAGDAGVARSR